MTTLWDFAGVDGLEVARTLFGEAAARLSVWQSLEADDFSLLRLCENNFRARLADGAALEAAARGRRVWVKACPLAVLTARDDLGALLPSLTVKPPHRLEGLPMGRAVPTRLNDQAVLLWRHDPAGRPVLEVHTAARDAEAVRASLCRADLLSARPVPTTAHSSLAPPRADAAADSSTFVRATGARGETP